MFGTQKPRESKNIIFFFQVTLLDHAIWSSNDFVGGGLLSLLVISLVEVR